LEKIFEKFALFGMFRILDMVKIKET